MRSLSDVQKQEMWESWVRKPIYGDDGVYNVGPRYAVLEHFVKRGLFPFVKSKGFRLRGDEPKVLKSFLRYLFEVFLGSKVRFTNPYPNCLRDHKEEFDHRFDSLELEVFWDRWGSIQDFQEDAYAFQVRYTLPLFLWAWIDLENSPICIKIESILDEVEEYEATREPRGKDDPYLQETSKANYEDRHWH